MTRAQEAEENYIIKRELAVVKQQCFSATENLQKAQSTIRQLQDQQVRDEKTKRRKEIQRYRLSWSSLFLEIRAGKDKSLHVSSEIFSMLQYQQSTMDQSFCLAIHYIFPLDR